MNLRYLQLICASLLCVGCAGRLISNAQERALGEGVDVEIRKQYRMVSAEDPVAKWAESLVMPLSEASDQFRPTSDIDGYKIGVIADNQLVNAFAAPGGYTYVSTGLILRTSTCAEIAGVMGHEFAHVTQRHSAKGIEKSLAVEQITALFLQEGLAKDAALRTWEFIRSTQLSREDEREADLIGLQITYESGYDPYGLIVFFEKLSADGGNEVSDFLSSHPATSKRLAAVSTEITERYGREFKRGDPARTRCKTKLTLAEVQNRIRHGNIELAEYSDNAPNGNMLGELAKGNQGR